MAKIERVTGKIFGENATATGLDPQIGQFGSALAGTYVGTTDISTIQQLPAWGQGFIGAVTTANQFPALPEMTGFGKVLSYQQNYLLQQGIAEWDSGTTYYDGSFCSLNRKLYVSITNDNLNNNPENDTANWQEFSSGGGAGLEIGDIGIAVLGIDETLGKRRYLNGQVIIQEQYQVFANKVKSAIVLYPNLACSEQDWQATATLSAFGQCGKFVVDDEAGTIRLPKITGFVQGLNDLASLGSLAEAGLPNITGSATGGDDWGLINTDGIVSGAIYKGSEMPYVNEGSTDIRTSYHLALDASRSSSIYGNSDTVQPESTRYPYFIQIATGSEAEVNIVNEIELNNPYTLFDSKYTEAELFNASWLKSNGQYNSGSVYVSAYQGLLIENNADIEVGTTVNNYTKRGLSVKLSTETYTDLDFVLNTSDETFRLPILTTNRVLIDKKEPTSDNTTWYNLYSDGWCEQGGKTEEWLGGSHTYNIVFEKTYKDINYNVLATNFNDTAGADSNTTWTTANYTTNGFQIYQNADTGTNGFYWKTSGYVTVTSDSNLYLYFYIGETVQNANLINAGRIEEKVAGLIPDNSSLISSYSAPSNNSLELVVGATGTAYTMPANGWLLWSVVAPNLSFYGLNNNSKGYDVGNVAMGDGYKTAFCIPVAKNDVVSIEFQVAPSTSTLRFIYAEGEV